jgi:methionyl-tRNA synthetase
MSSDAKDTFYVTTPIYYVNDVPHIGHAYTSVATDFVARFHRLRGEEVFFLTGTDEHGQKVARSAEAKGVTPQEFTDSMEPLWREVWRRLDISNDDYIRTTQPRHVDVVRRFMQALHDAGHIYMGRYEGPYCVACEAFYAQEELVDGNCPIHGRPVEVLAEENYFFRLSAFADRLLEHYEAHPEAVRPQERLNEVVSFIRGGLEDLSITRTTFGWGVPVPWDPRHVTYVWGDALTNYLTAAGYGQDPARFERVWPADVHFVGKDIVRFHAVYWPAMLMAAGLEPPRCVFAHGWLLVGGEKMSKTKLTGIHPFELLDTFGVDAYRYYFLSQVQFGQDGNFSWESMVDRYNADLANGLGNLASRVLAMLGAYFEGRVPAADHTRTAREAEGNFTVAAVIGAYEEAVESLNLTAGVAAVWQLVGQANRYLVEKAPWAAWKDGRSDEVTAVLYTCAEILRILAILTYPVMPGAAARLWEQIGIAEPLDSQRLADAMRWGGLVAGTLTTKGESLFPRLEETRPS